jgi:Peptidase_C39 like family
MVNTILEAAIGFAGYPLQVKAIQWLQASTGGIKQSQFALLWRDGEDKGAIDFVNCFKYYGNLPHQNVALRFLQSNSQPRTLMEFFRLWNSSDVEPQFIMLNVPFWKQTDNKFEPNRTCNTSCCAMAAKFLGAAIASDDEYYRYVIKFGDTTDHSAQTKALAAIGIKSTWRTDLDFSDLDKSLLAGFPIVIGILHRGTLQSPTGGHMIVVIGMTSDRDYICHDPYGSLLDKGGAYTGDPDNGNAIVYPRYILSHRWLPNGDRSGWGRLFYSPK